jgi:hypothetical protein
MLRELIDFISRYDPEYPRKIRGATQEEIDRLEQLAGRTLPAVYREFLSYMGKGMGGMGVITVSFDIEQIERFHGEAGKQFNWPRRFLLIGEHEQDPFFHYFLDLETLHDGDCQVVAFDYQLDANTIRPEDIYERAPSLKQLLTQIAFLGKVMGRFPHQERSIFTYPQHQARGVDSTVVLSLFEKAALRLGFQKMSFSTPTHLMLARDDAAIYAKAGLPGMVAMTLLGKDERELLRIREVFSNQAAEN